MNPARGLITRWEQQLRHMSRLIESEAEQIRNEKRRTEDNRKKSSDTVLLSQKGTVPDHLVALEQATEVHPRHRAASQTQRTQMQQTAPPGRNHRCRCSDPMKAKTADDVRESFSAV